MGADLSQQVHCAHGAQVLSPEADHRPGAQQQLHQDRQDGGPNASQRSGQTSGLSKQVLVPLAEAWDSGAYGWSAGALTVLSRSPWPGSRAGNEEDAARRAVTVTGSVREKGPQMFTTSGGSPEGRSVRIVHELRQHRLPVLSGGTRLSQS
ncbi:hypothetical protein GCM10010524_54920 [Streptomyces mexicanus]